MKKLSKIERFDWLVAAAAVFLAAAIGAVIWSGDHVGLSSLAHGPLDRAGSADTIQIQFSEAVSQSSVEERLHIEPDIQGSFRWIAPDTVVFSPDHPWTAGQSYSVTIEHGARASQGGRTLLHDLTWSFTVRLPRVVYLSPADEFDTNIFMADVETGEMYQLTTSAQGIEDFGVSPDGRQIAYSQNNDDGTADIWIVDMVGYRSYPITRCVDARCFSPSWNIERGLLAYQREELDSGQSRVWVVDLKTLLTRLLFDDPQLLGTGPRWSPDGRHIGVYDPAVSGIRIYDTAAQTDQIITSLQDMVGYWSPDGQKLVYPVLTRGLIGPQFYTYLHMMNLENGTSSSISGPDETPVDDREVAWSPDGQSVAIARRYLDDRFTRGAQIYLLHVTTGDTEPLVIDPGYHHAFLSWDTSGQRLVFQRVFESDLEALPEIWTYDLSTDELRLVAQNAYMPHWIP